MRKGIPLLLLASSMAFMGCDPSSAPQRTDPQIWEQRIRQLENDNRGLRERLRGQDEFMQTYSRMMNQILGELRTISGEEARVLDLAGETGYHRQDYYAEIERSLSAIEERVASSRRAEAELRLLVEQAGQEMAGLRQTVRELQRIIDEKEHRIRELRTEVNKLAQSNLQLRQQKADLEDQVASEQQTIAQQEVRIGRLQETAETYLLVATARSLKQLRIRKVLRSRWGRLEPSPEALQRDTYRASFERVDASMGELVLSTRSRKGKVRSLHEKYESLYQISLKSGRLVIQINDPAAFWQISRFLIIEIR